MKKVVAVCFFLVAFSLSGFTSEKIIISQWLSTAPQEVNFPVFHETPNTQGQVFSHRNLLQQGHADFRDYYPENGKEFLWFRGEKSVWTSTYTDAEGQIIISGEASGSLPEVAYLATYIHTGRWLEVSLELESAFLLEAYLNGNRIGSKASLEEEEAKPGKVAQQLTMPRGTHLLIIKAVRPPEQEGIWKLQGSLKLADPFAVSDLKANTQPARAKHILDFMDGVKISSVLPSPDGSMYAIRYRRSLPPSDRTENWTDIRRFSDNSLVHSFQHSSLSRINWLPNSNAVSYTITQNGKTRIYCHHLESGEKIILADGIENFTGMQWSPDEAYIIYSVREEGSGSDATMRHILGMQDRQAHFRHRSFLYKLDILSGLSTRLTYGSLSTNLHDISPDGSTLVFTQTRPDYLERPFLKHDIFLMDMRHYTVDTLFADKRWSVSLSFSPDGNYLLATGGPSAFDRIGENIPEGMIANNYDTQAYIVSLADRSVKPLTIDFDPYISAAHWHKQDNHIYFIAGEDDYRRLFRYNLRRNAFERIETGTDFLSNINFSDNGRVATYVGNRVNAPPRAYTLNLRNDRFAVLKDTDAERYRHVVFGEVHDWDFTASTGVRISGRYYLPPDFDPEEKYPLIVYQYGGTNPVGRTFGGRYPFNLWAGNGYIVYVLQPSGATGYGQAFSAAHVNNWGKTVVDEIIEGTLKFVSEHPYVDPERVGVGGASYGGFMTMLLLTHTDIFATGVSHAGISNIASYWGDGYWGYSYSAEATAGSFPWNSPEIYVDQSPLFRADRVNTPLLLITGDRDTNVPPGESIQMYTALKLLGREVELVLVEGENHHILTYSKRLLWHDAIMAWWDKYLKGEPEWWNDQFDRKNY
ncbi:MAG: prolyl oligopeptidase family serine peptidase [Bacteroidales bacterium]|nr:prolyl oligopeptidase family serine peptidase [Bacteroidales bacterium]